MPGTRIPKPTEPTKETNRRKIPLPEWFAKIHAREDKLKRKESEYLGERRKEEDPRILKHYSPYEIFQRVFEIFAKGVYEILSSKKRLPENPFKGMTKGFIKKIPRSMINAYDLQRFDLGYWIDDHLNS